MRPGDEQLAVGQDPRSPVRSQGPAGVPGDGSSRPPNALLALLRIAPVPRRDVVAVHPDLADRAGAVLHPVSGSTIRTVTERRGRRSYQLRAAVTALAARRRQPGRQLLESKRTAVGGCPGVGAATYTVASASP